MRLLKITFFLFCIAFLSGFDQQDNMLPSLKDINGNVIDLQQHRGKWIVISYWAGWCPACVREMPELTAFHAAHYPKEAIVLGIHYDTSSPEKLRKLVQKLKINFPVFTVIPPRQLGLMDVPGLPTIYLINPQGEVDKMLVGSQTRKSLEAEMNL